MKTPQRALVRYPSNSRFVVTSRSLCQERTPVPEAAWGDAISPYRPDSAPLASPLGCLWAKPVPTFKLYSCVASNGHKHPGGPAGLPGQLVQQPSPWSLVWPPAIFSASSDI